MTEFKGTPGPWSTELTSTGRYVTIYYDESLHRNFSVVGFGVDEAEANARLMSAAPDLLEASIAAENLFHRTFPAESAIHKQVRAAIAKALGQ